MERRVGREDLLVGRCGQKWSTRVQVVVVVRTRRADGLGGRYNVVSVNIFFGSPRKGRAPIGWRWFCYEWTKSKTIGLNPPKLPDGHTAYIPMMSYSIHPQHVKRLPNWRQHTNTSEIINTHLPLAPARAVRATITANRKLYFDVVYIGITRTLKLQRHAIHRPIGNLLAALRAAYYEPVPVEWHNQNKQARGKKEKNLFYSFIDKTLNSNLKKNWSKLRDHWPRPDSSTVGSDNNTINRLDRWESVSWIISLLWKESTEGLLVCGQGCLNGNLCGCIDVAKNHLKRRGNGDKGLIQRINPREWEKHSAVMGPLESKVIGWFWLLGGLQIEYLFNLDLRLGKHVLDPQQKEKCLQFTSSKFYLPNQVMFMKSLIKILVLLLKQSSPVQLIILNLLQSRTEGKVYVSFKFWTTNATNSFQKKSNLFAKKKIKFNKTKTNIFFNYQIQRNTKSQCINKLLLFFQKIQHNY
ncbi:hypothetical protein VP01_150g1 [Puccinia sorghi]|uniref:Uncharacterized protein n=1 Tax=Puccinia sorghi TaxID=27349 RepID=A0A0L6VJ39_9BASI|nr:hypothetical protein VP01_150g1 [Puccinia sorghi]